MEQITTTTITKEKNMSKIITVIVENIAIVNDDNNNAI